MNRVLRNLAYGVAAGPALFLPFAYFVAVGWLCVYALPAAYQGEETPESGERFLSIVRNGFYAFVVQWPLYFGWVLVTRRLTRRLKLLWGGVMVVFSLFAVPWFLWSMWRRTERIELLRFIRRHSVRHYFAKGIGNELPRPAFHLDLPAAYRGVRFRGPAYDLPPEFCVVTAWNPDGVVVSNEENEEADAHLRSELERLNFEHFPVTGGDPGFSHAEPGHGIVCGRAEALLLARRFRQLAFFQVIAGRVYLVSVAEPHVPGELVGRWRDLVEGGEPDAAAPALT